MILKFFICKSIYIILSSSIIISTYFGPCHHIQDSLPLHRQSELEAVILRFFGASEMTEELMERAESLDPRQPNEEW